MSGLKNDRIDGKARWDLIPLQTIEKAAEILTYGAEKYAANNWQGVEQDRYVGALLRHLTAWQNGEKYDKESGKQHLAHLLTNAIFILWQEDNGRESNKNIERDSGLSE